jgi:hypothetical protein
MRTFRLLLAISLAITAGCARGDWIDRTLVTEDATGVWTGAFVAAGGGGEVRLELQQRGSNLTGYFITTGLQAMRMTAPEPIEGSVAGDVVTFKNARGTFTAELTVSGDEMKGQLSSTLRYEISLRRVDSSPPPGLEKR